MRLTNAQKEIIAESLVYGKFIPGHRYGGTCARLEAAGYFTREQIGFARPVYYPTDQARALLETDAELKAAFDDYRESKELRDKIRAAMEAGKARRHDQQPKK